MGNNEYFLYNTIVILMFTYIIGLVIALLSRQIDYTNLAQLALLSIVSLLIIGGLVLLMLRYRHQLARIIGGIKLL